MGLEARRKIKELTDEVLPGRVEEICGPPIPYEVDWVSFEGDLAGLNFLDNISCHRLNMALRVICTDDMGKEAVREELKTIRLGNVATLADKSVIFADSVLTMHCAYASGFDGAFSDNEICAELLAKL